MNCDRFDLRIFLKLYLFLYFTKNKKIDIKYLILIYINGKRYNLI